MYIHFLIYGDTPIPVIEESEKVKQDTRDFIVPIRMSYDEKQKITQRANKTGKNVSEFVRCTALGSEIKEKPDKEFYEVTKQISKFIRVLDELERIA